MKNATAQVYWPEFSFNGLGLLNPGEGYQIKMKRTIRNFNWATGSLSTPLIS